MLIIYPSLRDYVENKYAGSVGTAKINAGLSDENTIL